MGWLLQIPLYFPLTVMCVVYIRSDLVSSYSILSCSDQDTLLQHLTFRTVHFSISCSNSVLSDLMLFSLIIPACSQFCEECEQDPKSVADDGTITYPTTTNCVTCQTGYMGTMELDAATGINKTVCYGK